MTFKLPTSNFVILSACAISSITACATSTTIPTSSQSCFNQYLDHLENCNDEFNHDNPSDPNDQDYINQAAWEQCRGAASDFRDACEEDNEHMNLLNGFWRELISSLKSCIDTFGENSDNPHAYPENLQECVEEALDQYRDRLASIPDNPNACQSTLVPTSNYNSMYVGTMDALRSAAINSGQTDGKYKAKVNQTITVTAGIGITPGNSYNVSQLPCVKSAIALEIYQTKTGTEILPIDADLDPSDGIQLDILFFADKLIDASNVSVLAIYFDENNYPLFGEIGEFTIEESPITGDWNRDQVLNSQDIIDFLSSYDAQTKRADINNDNQVTPDDAIEFSNP